MLRIRVRDAAMNQRVPCRLHIKLADGSCWMPEEPREARYSETDAPDLLLPSHLDRYLNICQGADIRSVHLNHGEADLDVPPGNATIHIARGHEYVPIIEHCEIGPKPLQRDYRLERLANLPAQGWYGGDLHVHVSRFEPEDDWVWLRLMAAEDLHAADSLVYKHNGGVIQAPQYAMGEPSERCLDGRVLAGGEEFRDGNLFGHMIMAGIQEVIEPISVGQMLAGTDNYPLFATACDRAHEAGGIVGWAHGGGVFNRLNESLVVEAALGKVDFVEVIQFNSFFGYRFWRQLLNCGIRLSGTGGSDFPFGADMLAPWYPNFGLDRTVVHVNGDFSHSKWLDGIRRGKCFATNGPLLSLTVNGQPIGSEIPISTSESRVTVEARAVCNYPLEHLDILCNGAVAHRVEGQAGQHELAFEGQIVLDGSTWIAACARGEVAPETYGGVRSWNLWAHTSPVYCLTDGRPVRIASDRACMADCVRVCMVKYLGQGFCKGGRFSSDAQVQELIRNCRKAIEFYEREGA